VSGEWQGGARVEMITSGADSGKVSIYNGDSATAIRLLLNQLLNERKIKDSVLMENEIGLGIMVQFVNTVPDYFKKNKQWRQADAYLNKNGYHSVKNKK
jgi:hypothetical protein